MDPLRGVNGAANAKCLRLVDIRNDATVWHGVEKPVRAPLLTPTYTVYSRWNLALKPLHGRITFHG